MIGIPSEETWYLASWQWSVRQALLLIFTTVHYFDDQRLDAVILQMARVVQIV
jgi:hypothetical protein